jgi:hypothetical protein
VDQSPRGRTSRLRATGRDAVPVRFALPGSGHERWQRGPLQRTHRPRAAPIPRRWAHSRSSDHHRRVQRRRAHNGRVLRRMGLHIGTSRQGRSGAESARVRKAASSPWHPTARLSQPRSSLTAVSSATTGFACTLSRAVSRCSRWNPPMTERTCCRSRPTGPSSSLDSRGARSSSGTCAVAKRMKNRRSAFPRRTPRAGGRGLQARAPAPPVAAR